MTLWRRSKKKRSVDSSVLRSSAPSPKRSWITRSTRGLLSLDFSGNLHLMSQFVALSLSKMKSCHREQSDLDLCQTPWLLQLRLWTMPPQMTKKPSARQDQRSLEAQQPTTLTQLSPTRREKSGLHDSEMLKLKVKQQSV